MHNLRHWYYQNKEKIWKIIIIVFLILGIIYLINRGTIEKYNEKNLENERNSGQYNEETNAYIENSAAISGEHITESDSNKINKTIIKFLQNCKAGKYSEAYDMLSNDCREIKYNTLEKFTESYAKVKFNNMQTYDVQKWEGSVYKVEISEDILSTGNLYNNQKILEYITIVEEEEQDKLNVNSYVGRRNIEKETTSNKINVSVVSKDIFMEYEVYNFKIENSSDKKIKLDALIDTGSIYLQDSNGNKYKAYKNELLDEALIIEAGITKEIQIKFASTYVIGKKIEKIIFEDVILDYDVYQRIKDESNAGEFSKFIIEL